MVGLSIAFGIGVVTGVGIMLFKGIIGKLAKRGVKEVEEKVDNM